MSSPFAGALMITFFAPAVMWARAGRPVVFVIRSVRSGAVQARTRPRPYGAIVRRRGTRAVRPGGFRPVLDRLRGSGVARLCSDATFPRPEDELDSLAHGRHVPTTYQSCRPRRPSRACAAPVSFAA